MKSKLTANLSALAIGLAIVAAACTGELSASSAYASGGSVGTSSALPLVRKNVAIADPILDMKMYSLTIPANWSFEGAVIPGTTCVTSPVAVFRTASPDGLTGFKQLPRLDWAWSENSSYSSKAGSDCLSSQKEMSASDVLKYMIGVLQVDLVRTKRGTSRLAAVRKSLDSTTTNAPQNTSDTAAAVVRYRINNIAIEERLGVRVECSSYQLAGLGLRHVCSAYVDRRWAPQGKWSAKTYAPIAKSFAIDQQWNAKWAAVAIHKMNALSEESATNTRQEREDTERFWEAQHNAFQQAQRLRLRQYRDFVSALLRCAGIPMPGSAETTDAHGRAADDWCDYSLELQKSLDPNPGITKNTATQDAAWSKQFNKH